MMRIISPRKTKSGLAVATVLALGLSLSSCSGSAGGTSESTGADAGKNVKVTLILKDLTNPFFAALQKGAEAQAAKDGVDLTVAAGKKDGDEEGQIQAIENAVLKGQDGILVLPSGPAVNSAIKKARDAGLTVIALDTPPDPIDTTDMTFATDNFEAGKLIGSWAASKMAGQDVTIAMLDQFNDRVIQTDLNRDQGFLTGMGIDVADRAKKGDEAKTGKFSKGSYTIACQEPTTGAEDGGRTAMENCLSKNNKINLVYTINEPSAAGAYKALQAAGLEKNVTIVSIDGSCQGVKNSAAGIIGATSQQYPEKMATMGVEAIAKKVRGGDLPQVSEGLDFFNTGTALVTDAAQDGVDSISTADATKICW
jgi:fructose transport system substrate-binding protein